MSDRYYRIDRKGSESSVWEIAGTVRASSARAALNEVLPDPAPDTRVRVTMLLPLFEGVWDGKRWDLKVE